MATKNSAKRRLPYIPRPLDVEEDLGDFDLGIDDVVALRAITSTGADDPRSFMAVDHYLCAA